MMLVTTMRTEPLAAQRGAISIVSGVMLLAAIAATALSVDIGRLFYTQRHLQTVADMAALNAARVVGDPDGDTVAAAERTARENAFNPGDPETLSQIELTEGKVDASRNFTPEADVAAQNAVLVRASQRLNYSFTAGGRLVTATAVAKAPTNIAGLSLGSFLARFDPSQSPVLNAFFGKLFNASLSMDILSYKGLADASFRLGDLQTALGFGSLEELLSADVKLGDLFSALVTVMDNQGGGLSLDAKTALGNLVASVDPSLSLRLGDLIKADLSEPDAVADAQINLFQFVSFSGQVANSRNLINTKFDMGFPPMFNMHMAMTLIEPPSIAIGPPGKDAEGNWKTQAHTAQWRMQTKFSMGGFSFGSSTGMLNFGFYSEVASADAHLKSIVCRLPRNDSSVVIGARSSPMNLYAGEVSDEAMENRTVAPEIQPMVFMNMMGMFKVSGKSRVELGGGDADYEFHGPFDWNNTQTVISPTNIFEALLHSDIDFAVEMFGMSMTFEPDAFVSMMSTFMSPMMDMMNDLMKAMFAAMGVQIGGADLTNFYLNCGSPKLVR